MRFSGYEAVATILWEVASGIGTLPAVVSIFRVRREHGDSRFL